MNTPANTPQGPSDKPLQVFSNCHEGILSHLAQFGRLPALLDPAAQARRIAKHTLSFFREVVYEHHAEEETFLPLSQTILGRSSAQMGALGRSMHLRHAVPELMKRLGHRI